MRTEAGLSNDGSETGGILLGFEDFEEQGSYWVTEIGDPGPKAVRSPYRFVRDLDHAQGLADRAFETDGSLWIGDWHTHPGGPHRLSSIDLDSYREVLADSDMAGFLAILLLPGSTGWDVPRMRAWAVTATETIGLPIEDPFG